MTEPPTGETPHPDWLLAGLVRSLRIGIVLLDRAGKILVANPAAVELLGLPGECVPGRGFFDGRSLTRELAEMEGAFWSAMADDAYVLDLDRELCVKTAAGSREVRLRLTRACLLGEPYAVLLVDDNERVKRTERALAGALGDAEDRALRDPLTGLFNRRHVEQVILAELSRAQRLESPLSLLVIDLDHFKRVNDRFGHPMGDRVLVEFARLQHRILRVGDTPARIGGEEFCVLLPHTETEAAARAAERLHRVIRALRFAEEPELRVTASMGIASARLPDSRQDLAGEAQRLFARADAALYRAKETGRNRTAVSD
jgi:diguanylate cyclase (GGDEF)-like protein